MKPHKNFIRLACAVLVVFFMAAVPVFAGQMTITGTVTEDFQIVDSAGQSYDVGESAIGDEMVANASGKVVEATGTVEEDGGIKTIMVESYKIVE